MSNKNLVLESIDRLVLQSVEHCKRVQEEWKPLLDNYAISSFGRVYSFHVKAIKKPHVSQRGYWQIGLNQNGNKSNHLMHRLVAEAFIDNPNDYPYINHKDCDKQNNDIANLEWCTHQQNVDHAWDNGIKFATGINSKRVNQYSKDGEFIATHNSVVGAAKSIGKTHQAIREVIKGKRKTAGGYIWKFA